MTADPSFWAIIAGAALIVLGISPALGDEDASIAAQERGCVLTVLGIAVVLIAVGVRALR